MVVEGVEGVLRGLREGFGESEVEHLGGGRWGGLRIGVNQMVEMLKWEDEIGVEE